MERLPTAVERLESTGEWSRPDFIYAVRIMGSKNMGACCSRNLETSLSNSTSMTRVTDTTLQLRKPVSELTSEQREVLTKQKLQLAQTYFAVKAKTLVDWSQPALETSEFRELLKHLTEETRDYFRSLFLQGSSGEDVPFWRIKSAQDTLDQACCASFPLFIYCNDYKSWWLCSQAKVAALAQGGKDGAVKAYMAQAQGSYREKGEGELRTLLQIGKMERSIRLYAQMDLGEETMDVRRLEIEKQAKVLIDSFFDCKPLVLPRSRLSCGSARESLDLFN